MTENEAIEYLTAYLECESRRSRIEGCNNNCNECELCYLQGATKQHLEGIKMAIQALEEAQQYREIGTPEELQDMKSDHFEALSDWRQYRKIGTLEECRTAREKRIPKKPRKTDSYRGVLKKVYAYVCPTCGNARLEKYMNERQNTVFCWDCGQKLDWSDEE